MLKALASIIVFQSRNRRIILCYEYDVSIDAQSWIINFKQFNNSLSLG